MLEKPGYGTRPLNVRPTEGVVWSCGMVRGSMGVTICGCSWHQLRYSSCSAPSFARAAAIFHVFCVPLFGLSCCESMSLIRSKSYCATDDSDFARLLSVNSKASLRSS